MTQRIIFKTNDNGVAVIIPTDKALEQHSIEDIAIKDVPAGLKYVIVDASEVPNDRTFRDAWEWAYTSHDGVGGQSDQFGDGDSND